MNSRVMVEIFLGKSNEIPPVGVRWVVSESEDAETTSAMHIVLQNIAKCYCLAETPIIASTNAGYGMVNYIALFLFKTKKDAKAFEVEVRQKLGGKLSSK